MKTDRIATFGSFDRFHKKTMEKKKNKEVQQQRKERSLQQQKPAEETVLLAYSSEENSTGTDDTLMSDDTAEISISSSAKTSLAKNYPQQKKSGTAGFFKQIYFNLKESLAAKIKMTPAQQRIYTTAVVEESGSDSSKLDISYSDVDKSRRKVVQNIASTAKEH